MSHETIESMEQQLCTLYAERQQLEDRFGVSTPDDIANMVGCLEAQLRDFYSRFGDIDDDSDIATTLMLGRIKELSNSLDPLYSRKSVHFSFENGQPVLRAEWTEEITKGDAQ